MKQCDSQTVGHVIQHDWWECLAKKWSSVMVAYLLLAMGDWWECLANKWISITHFLLVMGCNMIDENAWQINEAVSPTSCWLWDATWLISLPGFKSSSVTYKLLVMDATWLMSLHGKQMKQCHSQTVGHGIQHDWWDCLPNKWNSITHFLLVMGWDMIDENFWQINWSCNTYFLLVMGWDMIDENAWQRNEAVSLTCC